MVKVVPEAVGIFVGDTAHLDATVYDMDGYVIARPVLNWSSSDRSVAAVDQMGLLTARSSGSVTVVATSDGVSGSARVQVNPVAAANTLLTEGSPFPHQEEPHIVVDRQGRVHVAWKEMEYVAGFNRVAYRSSADGGSTWSSARLIEPLHNGWRQSDPWFAVDEAGRLFFARGEVLQGSMMVVVSRSSDGGQAWENTVAVGDSGLVDKEVIHSDKDGSLYATYQGTSTAGPGIRVTRSIDGGENWLPASTIPQPPDLHRMGPTLACLQSGILLVAWWSAPDYNIWVAGSFDQGTSWEHTARVNLTDGSVPSFTGLRPAFPAIAASTNGRAWVAWQDFATGDWDVLVAHSIDDGASWSEPVRVNDFSPDDQFMPTIALAADGTLHAVWYDDRTGSINLVYSKSQDDGLTWSPNVRVTTEETPVSCLRLGDYLGLAAGGNGEAFMAWTDCRGEDHDIYFARSTDFPK
jgi:hypothetical protein